MDNNPNYNKTLFHLIATKAVEICDTNGAYEELDEYDISQLLLALERHVDKKNGVVGAALSLASEWMTDYASELDECIEELLDTLCAHGYLMKLNNKTDAVYVSMMSGKFKCLRED